MLPFLFIAVCVACGLFLADWVFVRQPLLRRLWLGLVVGLFIWTWFPSLFAFALGFNMLSNLLAMGLAGALLIVSILCNKRHFRHTAIRPDTVRNLLLLLPIVLIGAYLFHTHILMPENGHYYVGQTTYGDLAMHLGFIGSIAKQGTFPPEYSIFPGHTVNYPFLCETSSSTLVVLGMDLRTAYLIPAVYAFVLVVLGVYFFFEQWLKRRTPALLAAFLFFLGGGFGFAYFLDLAGNGYSILSRTLTDMPAGSSLQYLLDGFYYTPTNLPALGLRWVNPIVDMLIPQRATLFGWAFLFPCLYLLYGFAFRKENNNLLPLAFLAGGLPLIHTHSFLSLAVISLGYFVWELAARFDKKRLLYWLLYGGVAGILGTIQLIPFAFAQASESGMLQLHFNWCNTADSFLWFYLKNLGVIAILTPIAFLCLSRQTRRVCFGPLLLWALAECVVFQPNTYDNNKLLFVCFAFSCGLVARLICATWRRAGRKLVQRFTTVEQDRALASGAVVIFCAMFLWFLYAIGRSSDGYSAIRVSGVGTLLLLTALAFAVAVYRLHHADTLFRRVSAGGQLLASVASACVLLVNVFTQYTATVIYFTTARSIALLLCSFLGLAVSFIPLVPERNTRYTVAWPRLLMQLCAAVLSICLFLSGAMTVIREIKSKYMAFDSSQIAAAAFVDENAAADAVFLTDCSWHLNPVSVLSGRNIVCGPGLYLFYHGIDTTQRQQDVAAMFENPAQSQNLFDRYRVSYVYIGASERNNYAVDTTYYSDNSECVYDSNGILIYRLGV